MENEEDRGFKPSKPSLHSPPNVILFISLLLTRGPTVQCCGEGQCGHNELAAGFSHAEAIGQEHLPWSDGAGRPDWGDFERSRRRDMDDNRYNQL